MKFRKHFDYDVEKASDDVAIAPGGPSLTVQAHAEDADINVLMQRYGITGKMPENVRVPQFGDFTGVSDYQSALHAVMAADTAFMELPARVRARFENDPQQLLMFAADRGNLQEAISLGLVKETVNGGPGITGPGQGIGAPGVTPVSGVGGNPAPAGGAGGAPQPAAAAAAGG